MKRIGFLYNHSYFLGGGEVSFYELIRKLDRNLFEPVVIVSGDGPVAKKIEAQNIEVVISELPPLKNCKIYLQANAVIKLIKLIRTGKIDLIHLNGQRAGIYGVVAAKIAGIPSVWHVRETKKDWYLYDLFLSYMAANVICVSKSVFKKRLAKFKRILKNKIRIVYNGVDTQVFCKDRTARKNVRLDLGINGHILFGVVGNIIPRKGQDIFIKGLAEAKKRLPGVPIKGLMIGRKLDHDYHANLEKIVRKHNLANDIIFLEYDENVKKIYSALDVFVLPTRAEGFSRSVLEAMSTELPVIATRISEIEEAVVDGENAILIEPNDIDEMANAIMQIFSRADLRSNMGQKNRKRAVDNFDLNSHLSIVQDLYEKLINPSSSGRC